jgi:Tol biopolymer transport system component
VDDSNIWHLNAKDKGSPPRPFMSSTRNDMHAEYSPDGSRVAFESARSGNVEIWVCDANGFNANPLTATSAYSGSPSWSPDGRRIAYQSNAGGYWDIYAVDATGENRVQMTTDPAEDSAPSWSRDGNWIYFASRPAEQYQVWKMPAAGGPAVQVTKGGGYRAVETVDGKSLLYTKHSGNPSPLWILSFATGEETELWDSVARDSFAPTPTGIYLTADRGRRTLEFFSFDTRKTTLIRNFDRIPTAGLSLTPNGTHLVFSQYDQSGSDLMLVDDFR